MTLNSKIFHPALIDILIELSREAKLLEIDFYLVGAVARDYHFSKLNDYKVTRRTEDVDIAVLVSNEDEFITLKEALVSKGNFTPHNEPIKLVYKGIIEIDLLPFGEIEENSITNLYQPKLFSIDMPGFALVNQFVENVLWNNQIETRICTIESLVLLKLIAQDDRPQRTKDNKDIQQIIKLYFEILSDEIYKEHFDLMENYDTKDSAYIEKVCAHVIGRKLNRMLKNDQKLMERLIKILQKDKDAYWNNILTGLLE